MMTPHYDMNAMGGDEPDPEWLKHNEELLAKFEAIRTEIDE